jgi:hypothetical protein
MRAPSLPYNVTATGTVVATPCTLRGLSIGSTAGATVVVYDGTTAAGTVLAQFTLAANGFQHIDIADGVRCAIGIHLTATAAIQGSVRVG